MKILTVDDYQRVRVPFKPRTKLAYEQTGESATLTPIAPPEPKPAKVRFEKRGCFTVGVIEGVEFDEAALKKSLAEFP